MEWDWAFVVEILPTLIQGVVVTIQATLLGIVVAMAIGLLFAIARRSANRWLSRPVGFAVEFIRGTPLLSCIPTLSSLRTSCQISASC